MTEPGLSVWAASQQPARLQRRDRYLPASLAHPAKMLPAIARQAIATYTLPGETVLDPLAGIGTTVVEAVWLGREAIAVEYEPRWAALAHANLAHARAGGATGWGHVTTGDACHLPELLNPGTWDDMALVLTSPPYGTTVHGRTNAGRDGGAGIAKWWNHYGHNPANLARRDLDGLLAGCTEVVAGCRALLRPGGYVVLATRPFRIRGELVDFPGAVFEAAEHAGLIPHDRLVALLAGLRGDTLVPRPSFFQLHEARKAHRRGQPRHVIAHEDILVLREPKTIANRP